MLAWIRKSHISPTQLSQVSQYQYESLARNQRRIRLLTLLPGGKGSPIVCSISSVTLDSGSKYEAISYRWASQGPARRIQLEGKFATVPENLWFALERFRLQEQSRILWVDQICINQSDNVEKSHQVRHMGAIYNQAKQVLIWLGPGSGNTSLAVKALQAFSEHHVETTKALRIRHSKQWLAVMRIVENPYWNRLWIIQEIAHASRKTIFCGDDELSWDAFCFFLRGQGSGITHRSQAVPAIHRQHLVAVRHAPAVALTQLAVDRTLLTQLVQFRYASQTDPRDKIYAFSTLTNDLGIFPDYTKSVQEVYTNATVAHIQRYRSLNIICQSYHGEPRLDLPTWVPDWTMQSGPRPLLYDTYGRSQGLTDLRTTATDFQTDVNGNVLHVRGVHIDTVCEVRTTMQEVRDISNRLGDWASTLASIPDQSGPRHEITQLYSTAMKHMSLAGMSRPPHGPDGRSTRYSLPAEWLTGENLSAINHLSKIVFKRRLFLTQNQWWGIGPSDAQEGDLVCFLQRCDIPILLRAKDGHYVFVGEVDMHHAVAYPEALASFVRLRSPLTTFSIH